LRDQFGINLPAQEILPLMASLENKISGSIDADLDAKVSLVGRENLNLFIRYQYLQEIDAKWLDHLDRMEALREAVYLRHYAQKNPLLEYKIEGSDIFEQLIEAIRKNIASRVLRVQISSQENRSLPSKGPKSVTTQHESHGQFSHNGEAIGQESPASLGSRPQSSSIAQASAPENVTVVRTGEKVGRNDPCPCGSGKKFKHCHGR
jgi:preprotein translocase subunit SecA